MTQSGADMSKLLQKFKSANTGEKEKKIENEDVKLSKFLKCNYEFSSRNADLQRQAVRLRKTMIIGTKMIMNKSILEKPKESKLLGA